MDPHRASRHGWRWILLAAVTGFVSSYVLSALLRLPRAWFVAGHVALTTALGLAYVWWEQVHLRKQFSRRGLAGLAGGVVLGAMLVGQVLTQPASPRAQDGELIGQLALYGMTYGVADAFLLSILPVLVLYGSRPSDELQTPGGRLRWAMVALFGSALVTAAYHAGFPEFRGPELLQPIIGNLVITLSYLVTGSPWAPIVAHVAMHGAAVAHGISSTIQLPPHYG
jgi:hypothetical protein